MTWPLCVLAPISSGATWKAATKAVARCVCVSVCVCVFVCVCERQTCSLVQCHTAAGSEVIQANGREIASRETTTLQQIENVRVEDK